MADGEALSPPLPDKARAQAEVSLQIELRNELDRDQRQHVRSAGFHGRALGAVPGARSAGLQTKSLRFLCAMSFVRLIVTP